MKVEFRASFARDLKRVRNEELLKQVEKTIEETESAQEPSQIANFKKLRVKGRYYRIKLGEFRVGLSIEGDTVTFVRFLHRSEIYRFFPQCVYLKSNPAGFYPPGADNGAEFGKTDERIRSVPA